jgi:hypothetical protein
MRGGLRPQLVESLSKKYMGRRKRIEGRILLGQFVVFHKKGGRG